MTGFFKTLFPITFILAMIFYGKRSFAQHSEKVIVPQFDFTQIDSLIDNEISSLTHEDSSATVVAFVDWFVGSYKDAHDSFAYYKNIFEIYIVFSKVADDYVRKIDNFGYYNIVPTSAKKVRKFVGRHFDKMEKEEMVESGLVIPHSLCQIVKISNKGKRISYEYTQRHWHNRKNSVMQKYKFLHLFKEQKERVNLLNPQRLSVVWAEASE